MAAGTESLSAKRLCRYDVLRVFCALGVILYHFELAIPEEYRFGTFGLCLPFSGLNTGGVAVGLFFMLSGALNAKTLHNDAFKTWPYLKRRLVRLLPPFWISWVFVCVWNLLNGVAQFSIPSASFLFTVLGIDGYIQAFSTATVQTYNLVGEWFYGAFIAVTLLWPIVRWGLRRNWAVCFTMMLVSEVAAILWLPSVGIYVWYSLPVCLMSFTGGAFVAETGRDSSIPLFLLSAGLLLSGIFLKVLPESVRYQLYTVGILLLVRHLPLDKFKLVVSDGLAYRFRRLMAFLSTLTLYAFMFQHQVIATVINRIQNCFGPDFGRFDFYGLFALVVIISFVLADVANSTEKALRARVSA